VRVSGFVKDKSTGEVLIGATVLDSSSMNGTVTDYNGYFSFQATVPTSINFFCGLCKPKN